MKRIFSAAVLFILLILTVVALNKFDAPRANAGTATQAGRAVLESRERD